MTAVHWEGGMGKVVVGDGVRTERRGAADLAASFALAYAVGAGLMLALLHNAGMWSVVAYTRLLDLAITAGVVQLHDAQPGIIEGVPELELFQKSQEPIDTGLALVGAVSALGRRCSTTTRWH
ncbi:MAG: hypothetical protein AB1673_06455 [Actinomycetota bacterium]